MASIERFLDGQTAIVTGASSGIGAACAEELARRGANVAVNHLNDGKSADEIADKCRQFGVDAITIDADVSAPDAVDALFAEVDERFGALDILVANAGIQLDAAFTEMSLADWQRVLDVNLTGQFLCMQRAAKRFLAQGVRENISRSAGKIVEMSSVHDVIPWAGHVNYAASKGAIDMFMKSVAQELAPAKIRVNAVSPGAIKTQINEQVWENEASAEQLLTLIPYGRIGEPVDVARTVAWLVSDYAEYLVGTTLYVDGGMMLYPGFSENG